MLRRFAQALENVEGLINIWSASSDIPEEHPVVLLAVSGGMDSMCMADLFLKTRGADAIAVAHCNFRLRGEESDGDEILVREWAGRNGVRFHSVGFDTADYARGHGVSIEMAARELRYGWFTELCRKHGYAAVSVAHNANDNAETLILNLLRGTGMAGMTGMSPVSSLLCELAGTDSDFPAPLLIRPMLDFTRKQIEGHVFANRIPYRDDSTNFSSDYKRNRIRNEVFPLFEKINPSFLRAMNRGMDYLSEAADIVGDWCADAERDILSPDGDGGCRVDVELLMRHTKKWRYLLYYMLQPYGFNSAVLESIEKLLMSDRTASGKRFESDGHILFVGRNELIVKKKDLSETPVCEDVLIVNEPGTYSFNGADFAVSVEEREGDMALKQPPGTIIMDAERLPFPFVCRKWRKGDWFVPLGMRGRKKISDFFTDMKYDALAKDRVVLITDCRSEVSDNHRVAGILGVRPDNDVRVTGSTRIVLRMTLRLSH